MHDLHEDEGDANTEPDRKADPEDPSLTEYDKTLADSFPSSDPPQTP
jgi:hypothetical protein